MIEHVWEIELGKIVETTFITQSLIWPYILRQHHYKKTLYYETEGVLFFVTSLDYSFFYNYVNISMNNLKPFLIMLSL